MSEANSARILIADDEPLYLRTTAALVAERGFSLHDRAQRLCGIKGTFAEENFDLVLSDLNMPGNMKLELLRTGRSKWPDIPSSL